MKVPVDGGALEAEERGRGPALLLLHAFPLGRVMWDAQAEALAARARVVRFDLRGFGGSAPGPALLTMERIAEDAVAVLDQLGLASAVVCGLSMGGYAALALVRQHPERVRALVLADTRAGADSDQGRADRAALAERVRREGVAAAAEAMLPRLLGATSHSERPDLVARVREIILANPAQGVIDGLAGLAARADSGPYLRQITVPTLVICGEEDTLTPVSEAEALRDGIRGSRLVTLPRAGHLSNLENPDGFNAALARFLDEVG
jgi:pimeloyl-ACP methyl ester carboxylesterase